MEKSGTHICNSSNRKYIFILVPCLNNNTAVKTSSLPGCRCHIQQEVLVLIFKKQTSLTDDKRKQTTAELVTFKSNCSLNILHEIVSGSCHFKTVKGHGFSLGQARSTEPFGMQRWASVWKTVSVHFLCQKNCRKRGLRTSTDSRWGKICLANAHKWAGSGTNPN